MESNQNQHGRLSLEAQMELDFKSVENLQNKVLIFVSLQGIRIKLTKN
jgi:hypothetical protein